MLTPTLFLVLAGGPTQANPAPVRPTLDASFLALHARTRGFLLGRPVKPKFAADGKSILFLRSEAESPTQKLLEYTIADGSTKVILSADELLRGKDEKLTPEEKARRERMRLSAGGITDYQIAGSEILVQVGGRFFLHQRTKGATLELTTEPGTIIDPKFAPAGKFHGIGYVRNQDLYVLDLESAKETAVTTGGTAIKTHGLAEFVAQEEMGRFSGWWWSPDASRIAFTEVDHDGVETWHVADPTHPEKQPFAQFYPRPGKKNVRVRVGIVPRSGGSPTWVTLPDEYEYVTQVQWPKLGELTITAQDRKQQKTTFFFVNPQTGAIVGSHTKQDAAFLNLDPDQPVWLSAEHFLTTDQFDEGDELRVVTRSGKSTIVVPRIRGHFDIRIVSASEREVIWSAHTDSPIRRLFRAPLAIDDDRPKETVPQPLGPAGGNSSAIVSHEHGLLALTHTDKTRMPITTIQTLDGKELGKLPSVAVEPPITPNVTIEKLGEYWTALVRPSNFDPSKTYPVIVDVYGGPKHLHVVDAMRNWLLMQWLADQGFVVVAIENRGTPGRGRAWERSVYGKFGTVPLADQAAGLKRLGAKYSFLDLQRVGIVGWSFGGYMAANAVLRMPEVFHAGAAGAPVTDWEDYDTHYTERYLGLLPEARAAYEEGSLLPLASKLERPLLLIHGTADDNVYFRHTLRLVDALFRAGKDFECLPLPALTHMVPDPLVMQRLWGRIAQFFGKHLGRPKN